MKIVVYTTILGGSDSLKQAPAGADRCVCFMDRACDPLEFDDNGWDLAYWPPGQGWTDPRREAWRLRCVPHLLFPTSEVSVWVDASFTVTDLPKLLKDAHGHQLAGLRHHARTSCYEEGWEVVRVGQADALAVQTQMDAYRREGFKPNALTISCILVRQNTDRVTAFNEAWDAEIRQHSGDNTQLSIDYCAWRAGVGVYHLDGVRKDNPYAIHDHSDHKRRRKPYR